MSSKYPVMRIGAALVVTVAISIVTRGQDIPLKEFKERALPAWEKLREVGEDVSISSIEYSHKHKLDYHRKGECVLVVEANDPAQAIAAKGLKGIIASNPEYHFWIQEYRMASWQLKVNEIRSPDMDADTPRQLKSKYTRTMHPWDHPGIHCILAETFGHAKCEWAAAKYVRLNNVDCVEAVLKERFQYLGERVESTVLTTCIFDVNNSWSLLSSSRITNSQLDSLPKRGRIDLTYGDLQVGGVKFPTLATDSYYYKEGGAVPQVSKVEFVSVSKCKLDRSEFYLSHYDLPEPLGVGTPVPGRAYLTYILLLAAIFFILSIVFAYLRRRSRVTAVSSIARNG